MRLLLIDDHPLFGTGFAHALSLTQPGVQVRVATTLQDGLALATQHPDFDIALIDYRLRAGDGLAGLKLFAAQHPLIARVLISGDESPALVAAAQAAGASGFLGKSLTVEAMLQRLTHVMRGDLAFDALAPSLPVRNGPQPTTRQREVLTLVALGRPNKRIASELGIAERTVKLHVTALMGLLGASNRTHLLVQARHHGLL